MAAPSGPHDPYVDLGVRPLINANGTLTAIGGSRMPSVVLDAMREAALSFVDMFELQEAVSARIARLTRTRALSSAMAPQMASSSGFSPR